MEWKEYEKKQQRTESICTFLIIFILVCGIIAEVICQTERSRFIIKDYDKLSLAIVQIQATVFTLTIALLALMGGKISDSYLGVKYNNFILNLKPIFYTQRNIIRASLLLLVAGIASQMLGLYNVVTSLFFITCILIWISANEIYEAYTGTERIDDEIHAYVIHKILYGKSSEKIDTMKSFCTEWKSKISCEANNSYEEHYKILRKMLFSMLENETERKEILSQCVEIDSELLNEEKKRACGISFINECYSTIIVFIRDNADQVKFDFTFNLFCEVYSNLCSAIRNMDISVVERTINWDNFTKLIISADIRLQRDVEELCLAEIETVENFGAFIGMYISTGKNQNDRASRKDEVWGEIFTNYPGGVNDKHNDEYLTAICKRDFMFAVTQIRYDSSDILTVFLYGRMNHEIVYYNNEYVYMVLKIHCYLYYLAYYESLTCVKQELIDKSRNLIKNTSVCEAFSCFIRKVFENDKNTFMFGNNKYDIFNEKLEGRLNRELGWYEAYPINGDAKCCIIYNAIRDFVVFLTAYLANYYNTQEFLLNVMSQSNASEYYLRYIIGRNVYSRLHTFLEIVNVQEVSIKNKSQEIYSMLIDDVHKEYKAYVLQDSWKVKEGTSEVTDNTDLKNKTSAYFNGKLAGLLDNNIAEDGSCKLITIRYYSDMKISELLVGEYEQIFINFIDYLVKELIKTTDVEIINKSKYSDNLYIDYFQSKINSVFIGSEFMLLTKGYDEREDIRKIINQSEHYLSGAYGYAIIVDKEALKFNLGEPKFDFQKVTIKESGAMYNSEKNNYTYEASSGMTIELTEDELIDYLDKSQRVMNIAIPVGIAVNKDSLINIVVDDNQQEKLLNSYRE